MRQNETRHRGLAAVELALLMPLLFSLLFLLVEGGNAMHVYSILQEASREGARQVLQNNDVSGIQELVDALTEQLPGDDPTAVVTMDADAKAVTVEVRYDYQSFYGENPILEALNDDQPYVFRARTTMPLP